MVNRGRIRARTLLDCNREAWLPTNRIGAERVDEEAPSGAIDGAGSAYWSEERRPTYEVKWGTQVEAAKIRSAGAGSILCRGS